ncbi:hypothetical protein C8J56DRAFT_1128898 [Mycena floridula]|nr:hypothetical protein C8J56DRAFT_1128898 [Mycena floridula]
MNKSPVDLEDELLDWGVYKSNLRDEEVLAHAVDLEVIKQRSQAVPSDITYTATQNDLPTRLMEPASQTSWLQLMIANPLEDHQTDWHNLELMTMEINDICNGIYADNGIHANLFDPQLTHDRELFSKFTPNPILEMTDIPVRYTRPIPSTIRYPTTAHPNNDDATFKNHALPKPAELLLRYSYGVAAAKHWGKNLS